MTSDSVSRLSISETVYSYDSAALSVFSALSVKGRTTVNATFELPERRVMVPLRLPTSSLTMASPRPLLLSNWGRRSERWLNDSKMASFLSSGISAPVLVTVKAMYSVPAAGRADSGRWSCRAG